MPEWISRFRDWMRRDQLDGELAEELRFHRARLEHEAAAAGATHEQAARAAAQRLGNVLGHREASRDRWSWPWLDNLLQDVRYGARGLRRSPGFTVAVILTLGLGIGANAAMFGVIDRLMFRPLPFLRAPARVHRVYLESTNRGRANLQSGGYEYTAYLDLQKFSSSFEAWTAWADFTTAIGQGDASREQLVGMVSGSFFEFFEARPVLGRFFGPADDQVPEGAQVVVLSYPLWQAEYGGRDVLGEVLYVGSVPCTIIGVAPRGFTGLPERAPPVAFIPITTFAANTGGPDDRRTYYTRYNWGWVSVFARRKAGVSVDDATADLSRAYVRSWNAARAIDPDLPAAEIARPRAIAGPVKTGAGPTASLEARTVRWVTGVAVIVLLIACANVANLLLARMLRRRREVALRLALGVSRRRLLAQALVESLLLAGSGLVAGLAIAEWGGAALRRLFVDGSLGVVTDPRTLLLAAGAALAATVLAGLGPAILGTRADLATGLKAAGREAGHHRSRTRSALLVFQGTLSVVLLIGAGHFVRSLRQVREFRMGYDSRPVVMVGRNLRGVELTESERGALGRRLLDAAHAVPGVTHAALVSSVPFWSTSSRSLFVAGIDSVARLGSFTFQTATPEYFETMDTRILRGRAFGEADRAGAPRVAVVSQAMAEVLWPGREALGQCLRVGSDTMPCTTVVGITENAVQRSLLGDEKPYRYYLPLDQHEPHRAGYLMVRTRGDPAREAETVRKALQAVMPGTAYVAVRPLEEVIDGQRRSWQVGATMFVAFAGLALLVAAVGIYGVISYDVAQRLPELGVRIALGARSAHIARLVVGQGARLATLGLAIGLLIATLVARWIEPLLFRQSARDPWVFGAAGGLLLLVALAASAVPAARATRADPSTVLRSE